MRIFTYQHPIVWETIQKEGIYIPEGLVEKCDFLKECKADPLDGFIRSYDWLKKQMIARQVKSIASIGDIIWGWSDQRSDNAHNLRYKNNRVVYNNHVLLECEIPTERLLGSLYESWHCVLNNGVILSFDEEIDEVEYERVYADKHLKELSWEMVFDIHNPKAKDESIQYTFFQLQKEDILNVKKIENNQSKVIFKI